MKTAVVNFDDFYLDPANGLNWLFYLKGKYPKFKVTLFTVPLRSPIKWLQEIKKIDWIEMAIHGFEHDEEETFKMGISEMDSYLTTFEETGLFVKGFKGANWKVSPELIDMLWKRKYWLAVKEETKSFIPEWSLTDPRVVHGHIWMMETHNKEGKLNFNNVEEFKFISEVIYE
jgi:hypothetical protein